ncbi:hypothetical protein NPIL_507381 [Nephila pilipes]|uniref:Uncharacterized protein n=1 Tax=Nephila pilipes TaxID=299642 RepID=A0A8X6JBQ1_NEPPI|nr:hypothetical protein NPIL_507381 [Nephila pilipes]
MVSNMDTCEALTSSPPSTANAVEEKANGELSVNPAATAVGPMTDSLPTEASEEDTELFFTKHHEEIKMLIELRDAYALWAKRLSAASSKNPEEFKKAHTELGVVYTQLTAIKAKLQVPLFKLPINIEVLDKIVLKVQKKTEKFKKIAEKKKETPKNVIPTKTQAKGMAPAKTMAKKNLKRAADSDGFQPPPKHLTVKAENSIFAKLSFKLLPRKNLERSATNENTGFFPHPHPSSPEAKIATEKLNYSENSFGNYLFSDFLILKFFIPIRILNFCTGYSEEKLC